MISLLIPLPVLNRETVLRLIRQLPASIDRTFVPASLIRGGSASNQPLRWEDDPAFGWHYVSVFRSARKWPQPVALPATACHLDWMVKAYHLDKDRNRNGPVATAASWEEPDRKDISLLVKGCLLDRDVTLEEISKLTGLDLEAVQAYAQLFFNVRERKDESAYINHLVYPEGKLRELADPEYFSKEPLERLVLRAGYNHGCQYAMHLMGMRGTLPANSGDGAKLEKEIMANAAFVASNGGFNKAHPTVKQGCDFLVKARQQGKNAGTSSADQGGPTSLGDSLVLSFLELTRRERRGDMAENNGLGVPDAKGQNNGSPGTRN